MTSLILILALLPVQDEGPSATMSLNGGAKATRVASVRVECRLQSPGAGDVQMSITLEGQPQAAWTPFKEVSFLDLPAGDGDKKVTLRLRDKNGKESAPVTQVIRLDTVPPAVKIDAPARVTGSELRLALESTDAVALQYTEDIRSWSSWEVFTTPKTIPLSKGAGAKQVFVRFKDEAGNESVPARIQVESQDPSAPETPPGINSLSMGVRRRDDGLDLTVWIYGTGLKEMQAELDQMELLSKRPFAASVTMPISPSPGLRRLVVKTWDTVGREHRAEAVFQDQDIPALPPPEEPAITSTWRLDLMAGVLPLGGNFKARTVLGDREISDPLPMIRLQGATDFLGPLYVQLAGEWSEARDVRLLSGGLDIGVRTNLGTRWDMKFEFRAEAGFYYSKLSSTVSGFGSFKNAGLFRAGMAIGVQVADSLWTEVMFDFRYANYAFKPTVLEGDERAGGPSAGAMVGLSWRF